MEPNREETNGERGVKKVNIFFCSRNPWRITLCNLKECIPDLVNI